MSADDRRQVIEAAATHLFGERGYRGASIDEIARRSGVTVPVIYDHFASKLALYRSLIEDHYAQLRAIWLDHAQTGSPPERWIVQAIEAWFAHVERHPFAARMLFRSTVGAPEIDAIHRAVQQSSRAQLLPLVAEVGPPAHADDALAIELSWEALRVVLQGLALWWFEHPEVPRQTIVASAMNSTWIGMERFLLGETWPRERDVED